jgi:benzodiazapine receptor
VADTEQSPEGSEASSHRLVRNSSRGLSASGLVLWLAACFFAAAVGASASLQAGTFYAELVRPDWAPPAAVFGPVWTALYAIMAIAAWLVWERREIRVARIALAVFVLQLISNALWSWLFFGWRQGALSFLDIVFLWVLIAVLLVLFWRIRPLAGLLLIPYLAWVTFASALNYQIWQLNPSILA